MAYRSNRIGHFRPHRIRIMPGRWACQEGSPHDSMAAARIMGWIVYRAMFPLMWLAVAVCFRRFRVLHRERFPRHGAVLVVANHPSTWTDVLLLDVALGRGLHFLAQEDLFRPWARGALLRLYGALPLTRSELKPDAATRNAMTFRRCETLFDRGECVTIFPEGVSLVDRGLLPFRHGAARLALSYVTSRPAGPFAIVPVGIHYGDRTGFRSDVTVSVGRPIAGDRRGGTESKEPHEAARVLTERVSEAMRGQVLDFRHARDADLFAALEPLRAGDGSSLDLASARRLARTLGEWRRRDPETFTRLERRARRLERARRALRVHETALRARGIPERLETLAFAALGALPAVAGLAIHAIPAALTEAATRRYAREPSRVAFARITSGFFFYLLAWGWGTAALARLRAPLPAIAAAPVLFAALGLFALAYTRRMRIEIDRMRLAWLSRRHPRLVRRARRDARALGARVRRLLG